MFITFYYEFFIKLTLFFSIQSPYFYGYSVPIMINIYYICLQCLTKIKVVNAIGRPYQQKQLWVQGRYTCKRSKEIIFNWHQRPELVVNILK